MDDITQHDDQHDDEDTAAELEVVAGQFIEWVFFIRLEIQRGQFLRGFFVSEDQRDDWVGLFELEFQKGLLIGGRRARVG